MQWWQIILGTFFVLLPLVLMLDFWGDERLTARGRPIPRPWPWPRRDEDSGASHDSHHAEESVVPHGEADHDEVEAAASH